MLARKALAGTAGAPKVYVEDVFSTYLYTGTAATNTISNNIDLSGEGGLVWTKNRLVAGGWGINLLIDTVRGLSGSASPGYVSSNSSNGASGDVTPDFSSFNSNGYSLGAPFNLGADALNGSGKSFVSWTFRKAEKFFDVVTWTGNGTAGRTISHNLGSVPGAIFVKQTNASGEYWDVYHRSLANNKQLYLNATNAELTTSSWNSTTPTSTVFTVGDGSSINGNGKTYVAYLFAHDAGGFGDAGSDSIIKCGSYSGTGTTNFISLGWEPQWVLVKRSDSTGDWHLLDNMRGWVTDSSVNAVLFANTSGDEGQSASGGWPAATGFYAGSGAYTSSTNTNGGTYIYIAIRRGPMKTPETGTSVFEDITRSGTGATASVTGVGFPADLTWIKRQDSTAYHAIMTRLIGPTIALASNVTDAENDGGAGTYLNSWSMDGYSLGTGATVNSSGATYANWNFKRAPGFFDVVATSVFNTGTDVNHNLGVTPELVIAKARNNSGGNWMGAFKDGTSVKNIALNVTTAAYNPSLTWSDYFTSTTFNPTGIKNAAGGGVYGTSSPTVIYLFASLSGVSKIGTYTGNGSSVTVTTNFQPRFILVKRTDSTGDWIVSDSARGLVAGDDPYLELNTTDAEVTNEDWVDISSTSFTVNQTTNNANVNTGTYLYLAIA